MKHFDPAMAARMAVAPNPGRPATTVIHDTDDLRLVVFRIQPGQAVPPHSSVSSVMLTVVSGSGDLSGQDDQGNIVERTCATGEVVTYAPGELHGMRARDSELVLLAAITPRPGSR